MVSNWDIITIPFLSAFLFLGGLDAIYKPLIQSSGYIL